MSILMHQIFPLHVTLRYLYMKYFIQAAQHDDTRQCFKPSTPKGPGFVVYIIAPNDDMPLTGLEAQEREVEMKAFRSEFTAPKPLLILTEMVQIAQGKAMCRSWCGVLGLWEIFFGTFHHLPPSSAKVLISQPSVLQLYKVMRPWSWPPGRSCRECDFLKNQ